MSDFRRLSDGFSASPQIAIEDVARAAGLGFATIVNNRPDGEADDQPPGSAIEEAARAAGLAYRAIPVTHAGFSMDQAEALREAIAGSDGPVLAYCRSGTRSTLLWALARAQAGDDPEALSAAARDAGYDLAPVRAAMDMFARAARPEA